MSTLNKIVYLSKEQREILFTVGEITVGGVTITYNDDDIYVTPETEDDWEEKGLGITGASEGQALVVDSVDQNGKPQSWGVSNKVDISDYSPIAKTSDMTKAVGKDGNGKLWTAPELPAVTATDNGKVLTVVSGAWAAAELPLYDGTVTV